MPLAITEQAPVTVYCMPGVNLGGSDLGDYSVVSTVEVDPGDGRGWIDVTTQWRAYIEVLSSDTEIDAERDMIQLRYYMQGHFAMQARVTFTDGELYDTASRDELSPQPEIQVLPYDQETLVEFTDPRNGDVYDIIDGRLIIAFVETLDRETADQFCEDMGLEVINEWWMVQGLGVILPAEYSVLEAVRDWPGLYPDIIDTVDPDELTDWE